MKRSREILTGSLCVTLLAAAFCVWSAFGNDVNFCVTAGCSLYQDFTVGGVSLWWLGTGTFALLALLALLGAAAAGRLLAGLALLGDICLLLLMALTAPCVSCLVVAVFFALSYLGFRQAEPARQPWPPLRAALDLGVAVYRQRGGRGPLADRGLAHHGGR